MNKTLTALVMTGALALGACSDGKQAPRADVLTVIREDGKTNAITVTKYFDFDRDGNVDARLRGKPYRGGNSTDYLGVDTQASYELLVDPTSVGPRMGIKYTTPDGMLQLFPIARTGTMTPGQRDAINAEYHALK
jgi:hypothetical protein